MLRKRKNRAWIRTIAIALLLTMTAWLLPANMQKAEAAEAGGVPDFQIFNANARLYGVEGTGLTPLYQSMMDQGCIYPELAEYILEDKGLQLTSAFWNTAFNDTFRENPEYFYETILMDWLIYDIDTAAAEINMHQKEVQFANDIYSFLSNADKNFDSGNIGKISVKELGEKLKNAEFVKDLEGPMKTLSTLSDANKYIQKLSSALAVKQAKEERLDFLKAVRLKVDEMGVNPVFVKAVDDIIVNYSKSEIDIISEVTAKEAVRKGLKKTWEAICAASGIKVYLEMIEIGKGGLDVLFDNSTLAEDNFKTLTIYTVDNYFRAVTEMKKNAFINHQSYENAFSFNSAYEACLEFQAYAMNFTKKFVKNIVGGGALNEIFTKVFYKENFKTAEEIINSLSIRITNRKTALETKKIVYDAYCQKYGIGESVQSTAHSLSYGGHTYKIYDLGNNSYNAAKQFCKKQGGYLATISSKEENDILYDYVKKSGYTDAYFGLMRTEENKWVWVNGEESTYRNWASGESNNTNGNENYGMFYWKFTNGQWNDGGFGNGCTDRDTTRFICEWDNEVGSIDGCYNYKGNKYKVFSGLKLSWDDAQKYCSEQGGHLATVSSQEENIFLHSIVKSSNLKNMWIGAEKIDGEFRWVTGEPWGYTNWNNGEPNNVFNMQNAVMMYTSTGTWNDENKNGRDWPGYELSQTGFICEWDSSPVVPEDPVIPIEPIMPEAPTNPDVPTNPETPTEQEKPVEPDDSVEEVEPSKPVEKEQQNITVDTAITKTYGSKNFNLNVKAEGKVTYRSSDVNVVTINKEGTIAIKKPGRASIMIIVAETIKKITITVNPKKAALTKVSSPKAGTLKASWKKDTKASGYQVVIAQNSKFTKGKKTAAVTKNSTTSKTFSKLKKKKTYYVKVRAYKTSGKTKLYGAYSSVKKVKIK